MGADVSCRDQEGNTPLHYAVELDHAQIARALLRHGANVMAANTEGFTPATLVERLGGTECAEAVKEVARRISEESAADLLSHNRRGLRASCKPTTSANPTDCGGRVAPLGLLVPLDKCYCWNYYHCTGFPLCK